MRAGPGAGTEPKGEEREPIAIIGMGCRFPGVHDVESFWRVLSEGQETVGEYPGGRFGYIDQVYAVDSPFADQIASRRGGFLPELDRFDASFFGISPREAALLDPQQRLLLEVAWEAVDDAGLVRERLAGSRTGVFVGVWTSDYEDCMYEYSPEVDFYATTGGGRYGASGRLAYFLDVRGPNLTLDTACSSSLVAIHLACQSLLTGESTLALAGGVNAILRPEITLVYSNAGMLAPDGRCKFGDAAADGYVRSEGAGIVVLKRLSRALADGDPIYAVIRGSAVNNDGQSSGLLVSPSRQGQEDVIRTALESAGIHPDAVDYVEAHGTGTPAGDPVEIETIGRVMTSKTRSHPCAIGSVKTNIGHTESAAGAAGVMKVALALDRGHLPASLHFREPSPLIPWDELSVIIPTSTQPWSRKDQLPVAGVSGFGITGTNAHVILEGVRPATKQTKTPEIAAGDRPLLFLLSGQTPEALKAVATSWRDRLRADEHWPNSLKDLAYTAAVRRTQHECRLAIPARDRSELQERLGGWIDGDEQSGVTEGRRLAQAPKKAVFVYPGQGGQWVGMGRSLLEREPVFHEALLRCDEAIRKHVGWSVKEALLAGPESTRLNDIDVVQPTLFAVMVALTELWRSLGVEPAAVVGHSMGEVAAAAVAGALSLDDAAAVICHRSRLMKQVSGHGLMAVVELSLAETQAWLENAGRVWIAASNGATSTVVSGDADAVEALLAAFEAREIFCRQIQVDVASHSGHMDPVRGDLEAAIAHIQPRRGALPMYSTTTGAIEDGSRLDATYWGKNLRQSVLFYPAVQRLLSDGYDAFVEINAHPVLTHSLTNSVQQSGRDAVVTGSLRRNADEQGELFGALGTLHAAGYSVDLEQLFREGSCLRLPVYPWQRERHWFEPEGELSEQVPRARRGAASAPRSSTTAEAEQTDPARCLYELQWVDAPATEVSANWEPGHWIVLADARVGPELRTALSALGDTCTVIRPGDSFKALGPDEYQMHPEQWDELPTVLGDRMQAFRGVVHLWTLPNGHAEVPNLRTFWSAQHNGSYSVPGLVRALAGLTVTQSPQLWLVTTGTQQATDTDRLMGFAQGSLWGMGSVVAREHPELRCANLDLSDEVSSDEIRHMARLLKQGTAEAQMAIRGEHLYAARYQRCDDRPITSPRIRSDASYLVAGGLGGIGILAARWLVDHGARHVMLTARREPSDEARTHIAEMEALGATVRVASADLSDAGQVAALIAGIADLPPLKGICHLAVMTGDALLTDTTETQFKQVMAGKAAGAWNLYKATRDLGLDFCVFFSSIATLIAQPGQGAYAAANGFLDTLARYARARQYPVYSVQWGPWIGGGLSTQEGKQRSVRAYAEQGIQPMQPEAGFAMLGRALTQPKPVVLAAVVDWRQYAEYSTEGQISSLWLDLIPTRESSSTATAETSVSLQEELLATDLGRPRQTLLENYLRTALARVLKIDPSRLDVQKPVGSMGVDSLMAMEFVRRLSKGTGLRLPATVVFNYPTIRALTAEVARRMNVPLERPVAIQEPAVTPSSNGHMPAIADELSEEDAIRSLLSQTGHAS